MILFTLFRSDGVWRFSIRHSDLQVPGIISLHFPRAISIYSFWMENNLFPCFFLLKASDILLQYRGRFATIDRKSLLKIGNINKTCWWCNKLQKTDSDLLRTDILMMIVSLWSQVGSYSYDMSRMEFDVSTLGYIQKTQSIILDYAINIKKLKPNDQIFDSGALGNFSLAGFEMVSELI